MAKSKSFHEAHEAQIILSGEKNGKVGVGIISITDDGTKQLSVDVAAVIFLQGILGRQKLNHASCDPGES